MHGLRSLLTALIALSVLGACSRGDGEWHELAIAEGGFKVLMRGQPRYAKQEGQTPVGKMYSHVYSSERPDAYYAVGYSDFPVAYALGTNREEILKGVRDGWVRRIEGKVVASGPTRLDGYDGIDFAAEGRSKGGEAWLQGRLYLVDQRLYQVIAMGRKGEVAQGTLNRFLNSFRIVPVEDTQRIEVKPPLEK